MIRSAVDWALWPLFLAGALLIAMGVGIVILHTHIHRAIDFLEDE